MQVFFYSIKTPLLAKHRPQDLDSYARAHTSQNMHSVRLLVHCDPSNYKLSFLILFNFFYGYKDEASVRVMQMVVLASWTGLVLVLLFCFDSFAYNTTGLLTGRTLPN